MQQTINGIIRRIGASSAECEEREHTDVGAVWDLLQWIRQQLTALQQAQTEPMQVVVDVKGGAVTDVQLPAGVTLEVHDYDPEGLDDNHLQKDPDGKRFTRHSWG